MTSAGSPRPKRAESAISSRPERLVVEEDAGARCRRPRGRRGPAWRGGRTGVRPADRRRRRRPTGRRPRRRRSRRRCPGRCATVSPAEVMAPVGQRSRGSACNPAARRGSGRRATASKRMYSGFSNVPMRSDASAMARATSAGPRGIGAHVAVALVVARGRAARAPRRSRITSQLRAGAVRRRGRRRRRRARRGRRPRSRRP